MTFRYFQTLFIHFKRRNRHKVQVRLPPPPPPPPPQTPVGNLGDKCVYNLIPRGGDTLDQRIGASIDEEYLS